MPATPRDLGFTEETLADLRDELSWTHDRVQSELTEVITARLSLDAAPGSLAEALRLLGGYVPESLDEPMSLGVPASEVVEMCDLLASGGATWRPDPALLVALYERSDDGWALAREVAEYVDYGSSAADFAGLAATMADCSTPPFVIPFLAGGAGGRLTADDALALASYDWSQVEHWVPGYLLRAFTVDASVADLLAAVDSAVEHASFADVLDAAVDRAHLAGVRLPGDLASHLASRTDPGPGAPFVSALLRTTAFDPTPAGLDAAVDGLSAAGVPTWYLEEVFDHFLMHDTSTPMQAVHAARDAVAAVSWELASPTPASPPRDELLALLAEREQERDAAEAEERASRIRCSVQDIVECWTTQSAQLLELVDVHGRLHPDAHDRLVWPTRSRADRRVSIVRGPAPDGITRV